MKTTHLNTLPAPLSLIMRNYLTAAFMTIVMVQNGQNWELGWDPHPQNVGVQVDTQCWTNGKLTFSSVDYVQIEEMQSHVVMHRQQHPKERNCVVYASVLRNPEGPQGDPKNDLPVDSVTYTEPN